MKSKDPAEFLALPLVDEASDAARPWELIEGGRYRPRRIRGSFHGRELG